MFLGSGFVSKYVSFFSTLPLVEFAHGGRVYGDVCVLGGGEGSEFCENTRYWTFERV